MNTASLVLLIVAGLASIAGSLVMLKSLRGSPEGYQDAEGFHFGRPQGELVLQRVRTNVLEHQSAA